MPSASSASASSVPDDAQAFGAGEQEESGDTVFPEMQEEKDKVEEGPGEQEGTEQEEGVLEEPVEEKEEVKGFV